MQETLRKLKRIYLSMLRMDTSDRIIKRMAQLGLKGVDITRETGASSGTISQWRAGKTKPGQYLYKLANILQCDPEWLMDGSGLPPDIVSDNLAPAPDIMDYVPLLGYTTAGAFRHVRELEPHEVEEWYPTVKKLNGYGFALKVQGDSMTSPHGRSIPDGSVAIFNAANRTPENGELVLAKISGADEITFKKFVRDAGQVWLEPLNERYPPIHTEFKVLGVYVHAVIF